MREINLPIANTLSLTIQVGALDSNSVVNMDGESWVHLGNIAEPGKNKDIEIARLNGGKILYATSSIERKIERILVDYFLGPFVGHDERRVIFENDVIQSSSFSYGFKKGLIRKIVDNHKLLHGKKKNNVNKYLTDIMNWRNAFAHGHIKFNDPKGCLLEYYSSEKKTMVLDEEFWDEVENTFPECENLLIELDKNISALYVEEPGKNE